MFAVMYVVVDGEGAGVILLLEYVQLSLFSAGSGCWRA